ncbi:MAG: D-alanyl-D-alanine carboxypeptidase [Bauldia sp.]|uniref:D-alanyl-D-alanine carboxypeptidase family protein n=1 Tax=Bauldia sp. TaxID=2575872 RepID=UPI001DC8F0CE|nr:D-alanyl-D-alanine carboxypeptidase family protein [Bauldia sp.]MCB1497114.1 D-alanyl-D-alanine carboxypeptidase [Bauldia sp.]
MALFFDTWIERDRARAAAALMLGAILWIGIMMLHVDAQEFETSAKEAFLIDYDTGTVLFEKDADVRFPPASMAKLMTMAVVFKALEEGRLSKDQEFEVSEHAWRTGGAVAGGSTMFAELGSSIRVEDLIRGAIIQAGNDSCIILAEGMAGTEAAFADVMNEEAKALGLTNSHFANPSGLPNDEHYVTARDMAALAIRLIRDYPEFYSIFSEEAFTWNKIFQRNRNPLLKLNIGADGLITGFTEGAGYSLTASTVRDGQRLVAVVAGLESEKEREAEARKLIEWGYRAFEPVRLYKDGEVIAQVRVFGGETRTVGVVSHAPVTLLLPVGSTDRIKAEVIYRGPLPAPVKADEEVGVVSFTTAEGLKKQQPVYTAGAVGIGSMPQRALDGLEELLLGWW